MLLRRFYVQENDKGMLICMSEVYWRANNPKAPEPHRKGTRELKTEILPLEVEEVLAP